MPSDRFLKVSNAQAVTTTAVATDSIPLGIAGLDLAAGEPMAFAFHINVAAAAGGTQTYSFQIVSATAADGTTGQVILARRDFTTAQALAGLVKDARFALPIPVGLIPASATHLTVRYETANSAGVTVTAYATPLSMFDDDTKSVRNGFAVAL
jgi:hypothetical protein